MQLFKTLLSTLAQNWKILDVSIKVLPSHNSLWNKRDMPHKVGGIKQKQKHPKPLRLLVSRYREGSQS